MKRIAVVDTELCVGCQLCMFACSRIHGHAGLGKTAIFVRSAGGVERGFVVVVCRACSTPPCAKACPTDALTARDEGGVTFNSKSCIGCERCVDACIIGAVFWDEEKNKPLICRYCGYCAKFCPHAVLKSEV
jgi:Fe-S-cluster-containing dehydrogenase component